MSRTIFNTQSRMRIEMKMSRAQKGQEDPWSHEVESLITLEGLLTRNQVPLRRFHFDKVRFDILNEMTWSQMTRHCGIMKKFNKPISKWVNRSWKIGMQKPENLIVSMETPATAKSVVCSADTAMLITPVLQRGSSVTMIQNSSRIKRSQHGFSVTVSAHHYIWMVRSKHASERANRVAKLTHTSKFQYRRHFGGVSWQLVLIKKLP